VKHVVFDWNGTLIDDCALAVASVNTLRDEIGYRGSRASSIAGRSGFRSASSIAASASMSMVTRSRR